MANKETSVGGIVGFLRIENRDFIAGINEAIRKTEILDGKRVDVEVDADTIGADAALTKTTALAERLDGQTAKVGATAKRTSGHMGALATSIIGLGPALIPVAAGASALAVAFGGMGVAGIAAFYGVKQEMAEGTTAGIELGHSIDTLSADMTSLSRVASRGVLRPFQDAMADLHERMPALSRQLGDLATMTALAAKSFLGGLLNAFQALEPLMADAAMHVLRMSRSFEQAMAGPGVKSFGDYLRSVLPQVLDALGSITAAAAHLVQSLAPLGLGVLTGLQLLSDLLSAIPVDVLSALATGAYAVFVGFKTWQGLNALILGVNTALGKMNTTLAISAGAIRGLQIAAGVIGVALAALSWVVTRNSEDTRQHQQAVNSLTDAFKASHGAIDQVITDMQYLELQQSGAIEAAKRLGINLDLVMQAALGNKGALGQLNGVLAERLRLNMEEAHASTQVSQRRGKENADIRVLRDAIGGANEKIVEARGAYQDYTEATKASNVATSAATLETQRLASMYGTSVATMDAVKKSQQGIADKAAAATLQMQLENDAAGLLKQTLDLLNGENLSAAQAQNTFERALSSSSSAVKSARDQVAAAEKRLAKARKDGNADAIASAQADLRSAKAAVAATTAIRGNSDAAIDNRANLLQQVAAAEASAEAYGNQKDSAEAGRKKLIELRDEIIRNAVAQGKNSDEVTKFINEVLKIPATVPPTKAELDIAAAKKKKDELQAYINSLQGKTVILTVKTVYEYLNEAARSARTGRGRLAENANGSLTLANGVRAMADGDVLAPRQASLMRAMKPILWNEAPGGESYIPLHPSKRARSLDIWEQTGKALGVGSSASGPTDLSDTTIHKLALAMSRLRVVTDVGAISQELVGGMAT